MTGSTSCTSGTASPNLAGVFQRLLGAVLELAVCATECDSVRVGRICASCLAQNLQRRQTIGGRTRLVRTNPDHTPAATFRGPDS